MKRGLIVGEVWATRKAPGLIGRRMTLVAVEGRLLVALDTLDARAGQEVLVALGSGGRNVVEQGPYSAQRSGAPSIDNRGVLCDAAVALLIDGADETTQATPDGAGGR